MFDEARAEIHLIACPAEALPPNAIFLLDAIDEIEREKNGFTKGQAMPSWFTVTYRLSKPAKRRGG